MNSIKRGLWNSRPLKTTYKEQLLNFFPITTNILASEQNWRFPYVSPPQNDKNSSVYGPVFNCLKRAPSKYRKFKKHQNVGNNHINALPLEKTTYGQPLQIFFFLLIDFATTEQNWYFPYVSPPQNDKNLSVYGPVFNCLKRAPPKYRKFQKHTKT